MNSEPLTRRSFVQAALASLLTVKTFRASEPKSLEITLEGRAADPGRELVSFGLPLPPGFLKDPQRLSVVDETGSELSAAVRSLEPWRMGGKVGSIRAVLIQFTLDFSRERTRRVKIQFRPRTRNEANFVAIEKTLISADGLSGPRVLALIPAKWLCDSLVVGPQTPASDSGDYRAYDDFVEKNFPGSLAFLDSKVYSEWLFDRTSAYYKMFVRTGAGKFLSAAYHSAHFVRLHTNMEGPDAGIFTLKGPDLKYVYPRAMHIHYLLTGDERMLEVGKIMAEYCYKHQDPVYEPSKITASALGEDPERGRKFWTLRHQGYGLLGVLHGWELTGNSAYWIKAVQCIDAYYKHQRQPPDGLPPDGSLRQDWALYDPNEATFKGATSAWMMALLLDPLFYYWTLSRDPRVPEIILKWCDFLDRQGMVPDGSKAYYVINCLAAHDPNASPGEPGPDMEMHNPEMAYTFALGLFFTKDRKRRITYRRRFDKLFPLAVKLDVNRPARAFNWVFQFSSQLVYFMQHQGGA